MILLILSAIFGLVSAAFTIFFFQEQIFLAGGVWVHQLFSDWTVLFILKKTTLKKINILEKTLSEKTISFVGLTIFTAIC